jgi:hypothetical protein
MKTTYQVRFKGSVTIMKSIAAGEASRSPDDYSFEGELERTEENGLSPAEHVRLEGFRALAPVIPSDGSEDPRGVMDAVVRAANAIAGALKAPAGPSADAN